MSIDVELTNVSKRFKRDWIIEHLDFTFSSGDKTAVLGANGSGKSTLLKIIVGYMTTSEGEIVWKRNGQIIEPADLHHYFAYAAPYLELIEEYTLQESIDFHFSLKPLRKDVDMIAVLKECGLFSHIDKQVRNLSSGMKQRLKLILTLCSDVDYYFLDEPCSNLDQPGIDWYNTLITGLPNDKSIVVASNSEVEYSFCNRFLRNF